MHILITGGAGFIGSNFVHYLCKINKSIKITIVDKLTYAGNLDNLNPLLSDSRIRFIKGSINDWSLFEKLSKEIDCIVNFASESHVDRSIEDASLFLESNVKGVMNLLEVVRIKKNITLVQISTDEVYGASLNCDFKNENDILKPGNPYAASKAAAEMFIQSYKNTFNIQTKIIRMTNNFGPRQHIEKFVPKVITNLINGIDVPIYGTGKQERDWLYVFDSCAAIEKVINLGHNGEIYNVSTMKTKTNIDIVKQIQEILGIDTEHITHVSDRLGHDFKYLVDSKKIRDNIGWNIKYGFEKGLLETVKWYTK